MTKAVAALSIAFMAIVGSACGPSSEGSGPEQPTFEFVIPAGAGDRIDNGEPLDILPRELVADLNETIQIINNDDERHILGPWSVGAGETLRQRFNVPGVYEGACSVHPSGEFTVVVNEAA
ncbi:MAG: hypothetical protein AB8G14_10315 [Ilumatobacter sp.]